MSSSSFGKHSSGATSGQSAVPEPSFAERARTLMHLGRIGTLSTLSRKQPGFPFGSLMPYALDGQGRPVFLMSTMAMHTQNLQADPLCSAKTSAVRNMHQCRCKFKEFYACREEDLFSQTALCEAELQCLDFKWLGSVTSIPFLSASGNCCGMDGSL